MRTLWRTRKEVDRITSWGAFHKDKKESEKGFDEYDLLHLPFTESKKSAYRLTNKVMCYTLSNSDALQFKYLYEEMPIIELYEFYAIKLSIHHVTK